MNFIFINMAEQREYKETLEPTMKLRWLRSEYHYKTFWIKRTAFIYNTLQQMFIDKNGNEVWENIDVEKVKYEI